jgi:hypothetical protein
MKKRASTVSFLGLSKLNKEVTDRCSQENRVSRKIFSRITAILSIAYYSLPARKLMTTLQTGFDNLSGHFSFGGIGVPDNRYFVLHAG